MAKLQTARIQQLFLEALELPLEHRTAWVSKQCGSDSKLAADVLSLLDHVAPTVDLLELDLADAIPDASQVINDTIVPTETGRTQCDDTECDDSHCFLSRLSEVGVLSEDEFQAVSDSVFEAKSALSPKAIASQLVAKKRLTDYQASALINGSPNLLVGKYLILDLIGAGGMGVVFKAVHRKMNRLVAIKMILQQTPASTEQVKRFQREVQVAATLEHPNIVRAYDADESGGVSFLVMEYVPGRNLSSLVHHSGPLSLSVAINYLRQAAVGLQHAHEQGVVHRDVKPSNLLVDEQGVLKVLDLGLAQIDESLRQANQQNAYSDSGESDGFKTELTMVGSILGTASFMAPEQSLDARRVDVRSDIYSLGCTLYFLLTGDTPYTGNTMLEVLIQHREGQCPKLRAKRSDVPESVEAVFQNMVAKRMDDRFQAVSDLIVALDACWVEDQPAGNTAQQTVQGDATDKATVAFAETVDRSGFATTANRRTVQRIGIITVAAIALITVLWEKFDTTPNQMTVRTEIEDVIDLAAVGTIAQLESGAHDVVAESFLKWAGYRRSHRWRLDHHRFAEWIPMVREVRMGVDPEHLDHLIPIAGDHEPATSVAISERLGQIPQNVLESRHVCVQVVLNDGSVSRPCCGRVISTDGGNKAYWSP